MAMYNKLFKNVQRWTAFILIAALFVSAFPMRVSAAKSEKSDRVIVSLGDSYSSGEGIEKFYGQDKKLKVKVQDIDWLAHRSQRSWPGMLTLPGVDGTMAENRADGAFEGEHWYFAAVSGATTDDIITSAEYKDMSEEEKSSSI